MRVSFLMGLAVLLAACGAASAEDIMQGSDSVVSVVTGIYASDDDDNQDRVREFDGRKFNVLGIERLHALGYKGRFQYRLEARDLLLGDEEVDLGLYTGSRFGFTFGMSRLLHRLARIPSLNPNPLLGGFTSAGSPFGDAFIDIDPDRSVYLDRTVTALGARLMCGSQNNQRITMNYWQESENGFRQVLFRSMQNFTRPGESTPLIRNNERGSASIPIDRDTKQTSLGTDLKLGKSTVLNYRYIATDFDERGGRAEDPNRDFSPVNTLTRIKTDTRGHVLKMRGQLSDKLFITGSHTSKERENTRAVQSARTSADIRSTNIALTYRATDSLTLSGRYRDYDLTNNVSPVLSGDGTSTNAGLSRELRSFELDASYSGIRRAFLRLGYERREVDRKFDPLRPANEDIRRPITSISTDSNIFKARLRYYPSARFSVNGMYEDSNSDDSGYIGVGSRLKKSNLNATYLLTDALALYYDYNRWSERSESALIPLGIIPPQVDTPQDAEIREMAAGQDYRYKNTTSSIGAWCVISPRLSLDLNLAEVKTGASALWVLGMDPLFLPHLAPGYAPYTADNRQVSLGATFAATPSTRVYGRFLNSRSNGHVLLDTAVFPAEAGAVWTPTDVTDNRWTLGVAHDISARDRLQVDFSRSHWRDRIDAAISGRYILTRLAWTRTF